MFFEPHLTNWLKVAGEKENEWAGSPFAVPGKVSRVIASEAYIVSRGSVAEKFDNVEAKYSRFWRGSSSWALSGPLTFDLRIRLLVLRLPSTSRVALSSEMLAKNLGMLSYSESVLMILETAWFRVSTWLNNETAVANSCHPISSVQLSFKGQSHSLHNPTA
jgi:hypothetical protein